MSDQGTVSYRGVRTGGKALVLRSDRTGVRPLKQRGYLPRVPFEWGDIGSGSAELAYQLLWDALDWPPMLPIYQEFKHSFVAGWPRDGWEITRQEIVAWAEEAERAYDEREQNIRRNLEEDGPPDPSGNSQAPEGGPGMNTSRCRGCGKAIVWAVDEKGTRHPLDPSVVTYEADIQEGDPIRVRRTPIREPLKVPTVMISHFKTCPKANEFSKATKKEQT